MSHICSIRIKHFQACFFYSNLYNSCTNYHRKSHKSILALATYIHQKCMKLFKFVRSSKFLPGLHKSAVNITAVLNPVFLKKPLIRYLASSSDKLFYCYHILYLSSFMYNFRNSLNFRLQIFQQFWTKELWTSSTERLVRMLVIN